MGLLTRLMHPPERRDSILDRIRALSLGRETDSGIRVSEQSALTYSAVYAAVRVLAESVASLPWILYERQERGRRRATDHPLYTLIHDRPNDRLTAFEFYELIMTHLCLWGNAYCEIERNRSGEPIALWPLLPSNMEIRIEGGRLQYRYYMPAQGQVVVLSARDVLHFRALGSDGVKGLSPIALARQAVGLGLAAEKFGAKFFANAARPSIFLIHPGTLSERALENLKSSFEERYGGLEHAHRVAVLEQGLDIKTVGIPPEDAQFLQTRKFQVQEIARIFRVPPHMLGDLDRATFNNIEHLSIEFVVHSLRPWLVRIEQAMERALLSEEERRRYYIEALVDGLLRGDIESRYRAYATGRQWGWLSPNDVRELENLNPIEGGDVYHVPLNMVPMGSAPSEEGRAVEHRQQGDERPPGAVARHRLRAAHETLLADIWQRVINRETNDILGGVRRHLLKEGRQAFEQWLATFFDELVPAARRMLLPAYLTYGRLVADVAAEESGGGLDDDALERFLMAYLSTRLNTIFEQHRGEVIAAIDRAPEAGIREDEAVEAWAQEKRDREAGQIAQVEATRAGNAVAKTVYAAAGIMALRWVAFGDSCPYCRALSGRRIPITGVFLPADTDFQPEGADAPLRTHVPVGHPPAHPGCDCMIVPSL